MFGALHFDRETTAVHGPYIQYKSNRNTFLNGSYYNGIRLYNYTVKKLQNMVQDKLYYKTLYVKFLIVLRPST